MANTTLFNAVTTNNVTSTAVSVSGNVVLYSKMSQPGKLIVVEVSPDNTEWFHLITIGKSQKVPSGDLGQNVAYIRATIKENEDGDVITLIMSDES